MVLSHAQVFILNFSMFHSFLEDKGKLLYMYYGVVKNLFSIIQDAVFLKGMLNHLITKGYRAYLGTVNL